MAKKPGGLGRQFFEIFDDNTFTTAQNSVAQSLRISEIEPRKDQPRKDFNREALESLADSIAAMGVLQPIVVRENMQYPGTYEIIAGERRWRAAKIAGLSEIPAVVLDSDELKTAQVALIENLQRENLNAIEEAMAYDALIEKFDLTQDQIAKQVGKSRSAVANTLRLLDLPDVIAEMVKEGKLSAGHARTLLPLEDPEVMETAANRIIARSLSVRDAEALVKRLIAQAEMAEQIDLDSDKGLEKLTRIHMKELERRSQTTLGRRVRITNSDKKKTIELAFEDNEDLELLLKLLCGQDFFKNEQV
jgi:ParB family chromosome partitioning protein